MQNKIIIASFLWLVPCLSPSQDIKDRWFVCPEDFGCVPDKIENAQNNSIVLQKAIDYTIANGLKLVSSSGKKYYIKEGLVIKAPIDIDFNMGAIVATDTTMSVITIDDGKGRQWGGRIVGLKIDQNKKAKMGIFCKSAVKFHISDCVILGIPRNGDGIFIEKGYENFVDNVHMEGGENYVTGIRIVTHDCHFSDCVMIDCHTAVDCAGSNFFERIHAWMGAGGKWIDGSTFLKVSAGGPIFLHQCFSDTFDRSVDVSKSARVFISQQKNFHNKQMWKREADKIQPFFLYFSSEEVAKNSQIVLDNSYIGGLYIDGKNRQSFSNVDGHHIIINNSYIE